MTPETVFFFVRDASRRFRFFSSEPVRQPGIKISRKRELWETAKRKLTLLPAKALRKELAFEQAAGRKGKPIRVLYSGNGLSESGVRTRFRFFLHRERTRHILILAGEALVLPLTALTMPLPGPNLVFYVLAVIMIVQWNALRGIGRLLREEVEFLADPVLNAWAEAVEEGREADLPGILERLEGEHGLRNLGKILLKGGRNRGDSASSLA